MQRLVPGAALIFSSTLRQSRPRPHAVAQGCGRGFRVTLTCCFTGLGETFPAKHSRTFDTLKLLAGQDKLVRPADFSVLTEASWVFTEMSLAEQSQQWFPTSVQVTVLQARGLRSKGKNGSNDAYAIMQVAKDKFSTSVAEKSVAPVWKEEAAFDLPLFHPSNAERCTLQVCVMHRALVGPDKMLGQATINLLELQDNKSRNKTEWVILIGILYNQLYIYIYIYYIFIIQQLVLVLVGKIISCILYTFCLIF